MATNSTLHGNAFPEDLLFIIAQDLGPADLFALLCACSHFHHSVAPLLYRSVEIDVPPQGYRGGELAHRPLRQLASLVSSIRHASSAQPFRFYPQYIQSLSYISYSPSLDLRALPLLATVLRSATSLRHLQLDVPDESLPLTLDIFRRHSLIRSPPKSMLDALHLTTATVACLPRLQSVRSTKVVIVAELMAHRSLHTLAVDHSVPAKDLAPLFLHLPIPSTHSLVRLSLSTYCEQGEYGTVVRAVALTFPALQHLGLRCPRRRSVVLLQVSFSIALPVRRAETHLFPALRAFSVNYGVRRGDFVDTLQTVQDAVEQVGATRSQLLLVTYGKARISRTGKEKPWTLEPHVQPEECLWLIRRGPNARARMPRALTCIAPEVPDSQALTVPLLPFAIPAMATYAVYPTPFERFLLGAPNPIVDKFFSHWSPDLIMRLRCLNSTFYLSVEAYIERAWSIEHSFDRWFLHPYSFLRALDQCGAIVSGSEAQQHLARHEYRGRDLDIYVPCHGLLKMGRWLKQQGFLYQASAGKHVLFDAAAVMFSSAIGHDVGIRHGVDSERPLFYATFNFCRPRCDTSASGLDGVHVQLIAVRGDPVQFLVENFHSTAVMNYVTGQYAASLFPRTTFLDHHMIICQDTSVDTRVHPSCIAKYQRRGFTIFTSDNAIPRTAELLCWDRRVGDSFTWILPHERRSRLLPAKRENPKVPDVSFEVLPQHSGVVASGAALRIGPKFIYRYVLQSQW
ncbi:hypothetical protein FKP32DRAFT_1584103 [Trametes sanguinea]|nr:hypothetical protein FKP32DRAFT_1584103 [Trametes sanguinea]